MSSNDDPGPDEASGGIPYDAGGWVDVDDDDHWQPSVEERARALVILLIVGGALFLAAAVASLDGGDDDRVAAQDAANTTTTGSSTTTTAPPDPASLDGEAPPEGCETDDRDANPLRGRDLSTVLVLNGTPRGGHAGASTDDLEEHGYSTMAPDNAGSHDTTLVEWLPGFCAEADRLLDDLAIPTATREPFDEDSDVFLGRAVLVVTLGRDSL